MRTAESFGFSAPTKRIPTQKTFRFGNMAKYPPLGRVIPTGKVTGCELPGPMEAETLSIAADIIPSDVPLLPPNAQLQCMRATLGFHM